MVRVIRGVISLGALALFSAAGLSVEVATHVAMIEVTAPYGDSGGVTFTVKEDKAFKKYSLLSSTADQCLRLYLYAKEANRKNESGALVGFTVDEKAVLTFPNEFYFSMKLEMLNHTGSIF